MNIASDEVLLYKNDSSSWLHFREPVQVFWASDLDMVLPTLREVEEAVSARRLAAAGFVSYEAAPAFDPALTAHPATGFPLVWFMIARDVRELPHLPSGSEPRSFEIGAWSASITEAAYAQAIRSIRAYINDGETYQVNFSYRLNTTFRGNAFPFFMDLVRGQRAPHAAYVDAGRFTICSASPELFFTLDGRTLVSRPMKGTAPRGLRVRDDLERAAWLRSSEKNRAENVMIVDMMRNDIGRVAVAGTVEVPDLFSLEKYPTLWQLTSTVRGQTDASIVAIIRALFPAASITGAPKPRTMRIIRELESTPRRIYTGMIGFMLPDRKASFNVAIRTVLIDRKTGEAEYGVGGGIVRDSTEEAELAESRTKALVLTEPSTPFKLLETIRWTPGHGFFLLDLHLKRLIDSAGYFSFSVHHDDVLRELDRIADRLPHEPCKVRLLVTEDGSISCEWESLEALPLRHMLTVRTASSPIDSSDRFLYHKTTRRGVYEEARRRSPECHDVLLWNERGELTESTNANIVAEVGGELVTPPVSCGLLPGVYREWMLRQGQVKEGILIAADLPRFTGLFLMNSVRERYEVKLAS